MSLFRPTRTVTDPKGREWEIYVSRYVIPDWEPNDDDPVADDPAVRGVGLLVGLLGELLRFLWLELVKPLLLFLVVTPYRFLRRNRSSTVWIEAISWGIFPHKESIRWTTTPDHARRVLEQIVRGLADGDVARPLGGVFQGRSST